jgi:hypothetical protein
MKKPFMPMLLFLALTLSASLAGAQANMSAVGGTWTINLAFICGKAVHTAVIVQKDSTLSGTYKGEINEGRLSGRVRGNTAEFSGSFRIGAQGISFRYTGTVEGDTMKGTVDMGEFWTGTFTATRTQ